MTRCNDRILEVTQTVIFETLRREHIIFLSMGDPGGWPSAATYPTPGGHYWVKGKDDAEEVADRDFTTHCMFHDIYSWYRYRL